MILAPRPQALACPASLRYHSIQSYRIGVVSGCPLSSCHRLVALGSRLDSGWTLQCLDSCLEYTEGNSLLKAVPYALDLKKARCQLEGMWLRFHPFH